MLLLTVLLLLVWPHKTVDLARILRVTVRLGSLLGSYSRMGEVVMEGSEDSLEAPLVGEG